MLFAGVRTQNICIMRIPQKNQIDRYDFDSETAEISNHFVFAKTDPEIFPDGSTVDAQGYIWNAQWGGSRIVRYSPTGEIDLILPTPASQPSCVAFGGPELNFAVCNERKARTR